MTNGWTADEPATGRGVDDGGSHGYPQGREVATDGDPDRKPAAPRNRSAATLLVVAGISSVVGCFLTIPAVILGILALAHQGEPQRSAKFTRWGWIAYAIGATVTALAAAALIVIAGYAASGNN